jgi:urease accessory protein
MTAKTRWAGIATVALAAMTVGSSAWAHPGHPDGAGFLVGFVHPWTGIDHLIAMVAVGLWAAQQGGRKVWLLPLMFIAGMVVGASIAWSGVSLPWVEGAIATSVVVLGCLIALLARLPLAVGATVVGVMAVFHGYAHGSEATGANTLSYAAGFALATLLLHAIGVGAGLSLGRLRATQNKPVRVAYAVGGSAIAVVGLALLSAV